MNVIKSYIKSMRLYYAFITGIPGWLGVAFYEHMATDFRTVEVLPSYTKKVIILILLFLSWGINQIINDYLGLEEDRINAPHRPMVTGALSIKIALTISMVLIMATAIITCVYLEPIALIPLFLGVVFNVIYEYAKGYGILGNIVFGLMIGMCPIFGFLASGPTGEPYFTKSRIAVLGLVVIINGLMTYYTYFKDYKGDKRAGKKTLVVKHGLRKARVIGIVGVLIPISVFLIVYLNDLIVARANKVFIILGFLSVFLQMWTAILFYRNPVGKKTYYSLSLNFRACACSQAAFVALFNRELSLILFIFAYIFIGFLFDLYTDVKG